MRSIFALSITFFLLTACLPTQVTATLPPTSTPLPIPTGTPVPTATITVIPTPTAEKTPAELWAERPIKEFPWCKDPMQFEECEVPFSELQEQARFAQSKLIEDMFDKSKFAPVSEYTIVDGHLIPSPFDNPPHFEKDGSAPFLKDFMFGKANINGVEHYVIQVPYFVEGVPANEWPVMTGICPVGPGGYKEYNMEVFRDKMNLVPWDMVDIDIATKFINPETVKNFTKAEVQTILGELKVGNPEHVNGLVLPFYIVEEDLGWMR